MPISPSQASVLGWVSSDQKIPFVSTLASYPKLETLSHWRTSVGHLLYLRPPPSPLAEFPWIDISRTTPDNASDVVSAADLCSSWCRLYLCECSITHVRLASMQTQSIVFQCWPNAVGVGQHWSTIGHAFCVSSDSFRAFYCESVSQESMLYKQRHVSTLLQIYIADILRQLMKN